MPARFALTLLAAMGCAISAAGCHHHLSYHDRVWNGWCGAGRAGGSSCHAGCPQKASPCGKGGRGRGRLLGKLNDYTYCANGCGDVYVGPWISDPADCCDPCDAHYGCFTGRNDCCRKWTIDPLLWILRYRKKHCVPAYGGHGIPSSGCHYVDCPHCYGCHPVVCDIGHGGEGKCECGGVVGDGIPAPQVEPGSGEVDEIPTPNIARQGRNRVADHIEPGEVTNLLE